VAEPEADPLVPVEPVDVPAPAEPETLPEPAEPFVVLFAPPDVPVVPLLVFVPLALGCGVPICGVVVLPPPEPPEPPEPLPPPLCASAVPASMTPATVSANALFHVFIGALLRSEW
jgi:hypothetical protein